MKKFLTIALLIFFTYELRHHLIHIFEVIGAIIAIGVLIYAMFSRKWFHDYYN